MTKASYVRIVVTPSRSSYLKVSLKGVVRCSLLVARCIIICKAYDKEKDRQRKLDGMANKMTTKGKGKQVYKVVLMITS